MEYIYDVLLNFQDEYYDFYEWQAQDKTKNIKRILMYIVNNKTYLSLKYNNVTINVNTLPQKNKMFLITNGMEVMGIIINDQGKVIKKSSLLIDEAAEIINNLKKTKPTKIEFTKVIKKAINFESRIQRERKKYINNFLLNIDKEKDIYLLKYLYHEINNKEEENIEKIYSDLMELKKNNIDVIYNCVINKIKYKKTN